MSENLMIIVTGAPGTGKTTLSRNLAKKFNLPVISKDEIKELLFDNIGIKDMEWALKLGATSFKLLYLFAEKLLLTGKPFIVEGNFDNEYSTKYFLDIKSRCNYRTLQIICYTDEEVLYERYKIRDASGDRHPGHIRLTCGFEEYKRNMNNKIFKLDIEGCTCIEIDTTKFEAINLPYIYREVEKTLTLLRTGGISHGKITEY